MLKHALMGFGISLACLLPPIVHFASGPLGPFIGGWFAGSKHQATAGQAIVIGMLMGLIMVLPLAVVLAVYNLLFSLENDLLVIVGVVMLGYTTVLGTVGAIVGGHMAGRPSRKAEARVGD